MTLLFDRKYKLSIGQPDTIQGVLVSRPTLKDASTKIYWQSLEDWRTIKTKDAVAITDLQMQASISGTSNNSSTSGGNSTTIKIYNMAKATRAIVERVNNYVILEAGYAQDEELPLIFSGQVMTVDTTREGQDLITVLQCKEGYSPNNSIKVSKKFDKEDTYGNVITYLAGVYKDNGIATGDLVNDWGEGINDDRSNPLLSNSGTQVLAAKANPQDFVQLPVMTARPANSKLINGYSVFGYLRQALETVCKQIGYVCYITNGRLFVHPKGFTKTIEEIQIPSNILKSIRNLASNATGSSLGTGITGVKIVTFLDGRLDTDKRVKVLDGEYQGTYKVITKAHELDYEGEAWSTTLTCKNDT